MLNLRKSFETIAEQFKGLTSTARMLIGALAIILVMGLLFVAAFTSRTELVSLSLSGDANTDAKARAIQYLNARNISWEDRGGDVYVPVEQRLPILATLAESNDITTDQINFDSILTEVSPFTDRDTKDRQFLVAKMNMVARMISQLSGIERATVVIDQPSNMLGIGRALIEPTASVNVLTRGEPLTQTQADAIARMVAGAHAALKVKNVNIVDARTGRAIKPRSDDSLASDEHLSVKLAAEKHVKQKLEEFLSFIPGVRIAVNAQVDVSEVSIRRTDVDEPKIAVTEESSREREAVNQPLPQEPGVRSNTGLDLSTSPSHVSRMSDNQSEVHMRSFVGTKETHERRSGGQTVRLDASVLVPKSFFIELFRRQSGDEAADPDQAALLPLIEQETSRLREQILPLIETDAAPSAITGTVVVNSYSDFAIAAAESGAKNLLESISGNTGGLAGENVIKTVGLGALAIISLFLMLMMVKKATRQEDLPTAEELVGIPPALAQAESDLVGEASESLAVMEGVEVNETDVRRNQMLDQINQLATKSPADAATLIRKWIRTDV